MVGYDLRNYICTGNCNNISANIFIIPLTGNKFNFTVSLVYMVFVAALYGFALVSRNKRAWLLKWGVSIPFSFLILQYFRMAIYQLVTDIYKSPK